MARKKTETTETTEAKPKKEYIRKVKLSDGTVVAGSDNKISAVRRGNIGKHDHHVPLREIVDGLNEKVKEEFKVDHGKDFSDKKFPPPKQGDMFCKYWNNIIDNVANRQSFKRSHLYILEVLCDLYVELEIINDFIAKHGMTFVIVNVVGETKRMHPEVAHRNAVRKMIKEYATRLDLFPQKDTNAGDVQDDEDDWA